MQSILTSKCFPRYVIRYRLVPGRGSECAHPTLRSRGALNHASKYREHRCALAV
jgi:hypothetical protein